MIILKVAFGNANVTAKSCNFFDIILQLNQINHDDKKKQKQNEQTIEKKN